MNGLGSRPWLIVPLVAGLHFTFAIAFLIDSDIADITALHIAHFIFGETMWIVLALVACLSVLPMIIKVHREMIHVLLWPQQFMLFLMALSAVQAALAGHYPDGTEKPSMFILTDQAYAFWITLAHFIATVRNARQPDE